MASAQVDRSVCYSSDLLLELVNTRPNANGRPELLGDEAALAQWLAAVELGDGQQAVSPADALAAQELREAFVALFRSHCDCADAPVDKAEAYLQRTAARYPLAPRISAEGCTLVATQPGVAGAFGSLFAAAADLVARGIWARMKMCKNPSCWSGFFDKTRNSSALYCSAACSSQMAMRAYRGRLKAE